MRLPAFVLALVLASAACDADTPSPALVTDLRVLAVRADPPELLIDRADGPPPAVAFQALVVDPRGQPMVYAWSFCPVESTQTCGDFEARKAAAPPQFQPVLEATRALGESGDASRPDGGLGAVAMNPFTVTVPRELFAYHLLTSGWGLGNGAWASAVLKVGTGGETLLAQKRVVLNARDLSEWNPELAPSGWQICPPPPAEGAPGCLPLRPRTPNRNPEITTVERKQPDGSYAPVTGALALLPGQTARLRPVLAGGGDEAFQTLESTFEGNRLVVVDHKEETIVSWFSTAGTFAAEQTTPQLTKTLENTFTAPTLPPGTPSMHITLFAVARDQRGGVGWTSLDVDVAP